jgi:hypothetical protein
MGHSPDRQDNPWQNIPEKTHLNRWFRAKDTAPRPRFFTPENTHLNPCRLKKRNEFLGLPSSAAGATAFHRSRMFSPEKRSRTFGVKKKRRIENPGNAHLKQFGAEHFSVVDGRQ